MSWDIFICMVIAIAYGYNVIVGALYILIHSKGRVGSVPLIVFAISVAYLIAHRGDF